MPTSGLSLIGFMADQAHALQFLKNSCVPTDGSDAALLAEWSRAQLNLGPAMPNAGYPDIQDPPPGAIHHITALKNIPHIAMMLAGPLFGVDFKFVEIEPLLAFQLAIDVERSTHHCGGFNRPPDVQQLLAVCLPLHPPTDQLQIIQSPQSAIVRAKGLNLTMVAQGINAGFAGLQFGFALPLVHVVRFNGRCYLHNGFHRTYGARLAGATHVPCIFRDVGDALSAGVREDGATFNIATLESSNPPTVGHYTQGRAHPVAMRAVSRVLHVTWADYILPDE